MARARAPSCGCRARSVDPCRSLCRRSTSVVSMRTRSLLAWIAVGLAGLALAAGVTYAATQLSSQRIGLSAEPPSAGEELVPKSGAATTTRRTSAPHEDRTATTAHPIPEERGEHRRA